MRAEPTRVRDWKMELLGCLFPVEVQADVVEDGWLFIVTVTGIGKAKNQSGTYIVRGDRLSSKDLVARIPEVRTSTSKRVALVGVGALGAPIASELAMSQVGTLRMLDGDHVETGNAVRWPYGIRMAGIPKASGLADALRQEHPFVQTEGIDHFIGEAPLAPPDEARRDVTVLTRFLEGADLLIDASAELGISHLLAGLTREDSPIPTVYVWGTEGAWGGGVARFIPGRTGCWYCLMNMFQDHPERVPPRDEASGTVQPRGCATRTFTGARFDLLPLVAQATRVAIQTLSGGDPGSYPDTDRDLFILRLRTETGALPAPEWQSHRLEIHPRCPHCTRTGS